MILRLEPPPLSNIFAGNNIFTHLIFSYLMRLYMNLQLHVFYYKKKQDESLVRELTLHSFEILIHVVQI